MHIEDGNQTNERSFSRNVKNDDVIFFASASHAITIFVVQREKNGCKLTKNIEFHILHEAIRTCQPKQIILPTKTQFFCDF